MTPETCIACHGRLEAFGMRGAYRYVKCNGCLSLQLSPLPDEELLAAAYREEYAGADHYLGSPEAARARKAGIYNAVADLIAVTPRPPGKVVDYGCGWGGLCEVLERRGIDYLGLDQSAEEVAACKGRGLHVELGDLADLAEGSVAVLVLISVFEHLVEHGRFLERCRQVLAPGGFVIIEIPTSPMVVMLGRLHRLWKTNRELPAFGKVLTPPWHTAIFSARGLTSLLAEHQLRLERVSATPSARVHGPTDLLLLAARTVASWGISVFKTRWPWTFGQIFVFRKSPRPTERRPQSRS